MLAAYCSTNENTSCFKLLGTATQKQEGGLISNNTNLLSAALSSGEGDTCTFYNGPSDAAIIAFGESAETCGSIAMTYGGETAGSIAYGGGETAGSVSYSSGSSSGGSFSGGGCSFCC